MLQSHVASVSSFMFATGVRTHVAGVIFTLCESHGALKSLRTLKLYRFSDDDVHLNWPTTSFQGLDDLQLHHLHRETSPTLDQLGIRSNSLRLRTLHLNYMYLPHDQTQDRIHPIIHLPSLRVLDIACANDSSLQPLLSMLSPGKPPLAPRLRSYCDRQLNRVMLSSFLERSDMVSLYVVDEYQVHIRGTMPPIQWLLFLPHMRILFLHCKHGYGAVLDQLLAPNDKIATARCPDLHTLVLLDCNIGGLGQNRMQRVAQVYSLS
jgi:hypothetical protein